MQKTQQCTNCKNVTRPAGKGELQKAVMQRVEQGRADAADLHETQPKAGQYLDTQLFPECKNTSKDRDIVKKHHKNK